MADKKMYKVGITVKEPWSADISYEVLDITLYAVENGGDGCSYIAIRANQGVTPGTDDTVWVKATQRGQSIYDLAVKYGDFEGTEAEFEAEYEAALHAAQSAAQSASDIEARVETNEAARVTAERARSDAETARSSAETARINAENARNDAESLRATAESDRVRAEAGRVTAEASRVEAETFRQGAEQSRRQQFEGLKTDMETAIDNVDAKSAEIAEDIEGYEANEAARVSAEQSRVSAESSRVSAESARATAETARQTAEGNRATAETERASAEGARTTAEQGRVSAEQGRVSAESGRVSAESERVAAETARESASATAVQNAETATAAANTAAEHAEEAATTIDEKIAGKADQSEVSRLGQKVEGESEISIAPASVDSIVCYINSNNFWQVNNTNSKGRIVEVIPGRTIKIKASSGDSAIIAFVKGTTPVNAAAVEYATGEIGRRTLSAGDELTLTVPSDAVYLWFARTNYAHDYTPQSIVISGQDGLEQRMDAAEESIEELQRKVEGDAVTKLAFENGGIGDDGLNNPARKENNFFRCYRTGNYFRASKIRYTPSNDEVVTVFTYTGEKVFIEKQTITGDFTPAASAVYMKVQIFYNDNSNEVNIPIEQGGLDNNGAEEASANWVRTGYIDIDNPGFDTMWFVGKYKGRIYDANHNLLISGTSAARFQNLYGGTSKYTDCLYLLDVETFFALRSTAKYIRLAFATNPESSITPSTYDVRFTNGNAARVTLPGIFALNYEEELNGYISSGTISFAYKFDAGGNGQQVSQSEVATASPLYDNGDYMSSGLLLLPPNYSEKGKPTPLILWIHGSGDYGYLGMDVMSQYYMDYLSYWQKEGFAVADFFARTSKYGTQGGDVNGMPTNLASYEQGYKWLVEHYNIDRSGCFVTGKSMGGVGALMICYSKSIPVKAADILAPALNPFYQQCGYGISSRADYVEDLRLDGAGGLLNNPSPASPMSQSDFNALMIANRDKLIGYNAYLSKVPNKSWADLVVLRFRNPGTFDDVIKFCDVPLRIHIAEDDTTVAYNQSLNLIKALKNSGSIAEIRTMPANTGQHHAVDNSPDALKVASIVTALGYTCTDVPLAYVEVADWFKFYK